MLSFFFFFEIFVTGTDFWEVFRFSSRSNGWFLEGFNITETGDSEIGFCWNPGCKSSTARWIASMLCLWCCVCNTVRASENGPVSWIKIYIPNSKYTLGGGFKYLLISPLIIREDFRFDEHIFQMGGFNYQIVQYWLLHFFNVYFQSFSCTVARWQADYPPWN